MRNFVLCPALSASCETWDQRVESTSDKAQSSKRRQHEVHKLERSGR